jgi:hypothetical protein
MTIEGTREQIAPTLSRAFEGVDASMRAACLDGALEVLALEKTRRLDESLNEKDTFYVVHEQDLKLLQDGVSVAVALIPVFKPLTTLPTLVGLLFRYRRKRARIDGEQAAVLMCLRDAPPGGLKVADIPERLQLANAITEARVLEVLNGLRDLLLSDGTRSPFVAESGGYWTAADI